MQQAMRSHWRQNRGSEEAAEGPASAGRTKALEDCAGDALRKEIADQARTRVMQPRNRQAEGEALLEPTQPSDGTTAGDVSPVEGCQFVRSAVRAGMCSRADRNVTFGFVP